MAYSLQNLLKNPFISLFAKFRLLRVFDIKLNTCFYFWFNKNCNEMKKQVRVRQLPEGNELYQFEYQYRVLRPAVVTCDSRWLVQASHEQSRDTLHVRSVSTGLLANKIPLKYKHYKDFNSMVSEKHIRLKYFKVYIINCIVV